MKVQFIGIILTLLSSQSAAQYLYPKAGLSVSWGSTSSNSEPRFGLVAGAGAQFNLSKRFALIAELTYIQKGYNETWAVRDITYDIDLRVNYLEMPFLIKAIFGKRKSLYYLTIGPSLSVLIDSKKFVEADRLAQARIPPAIIHEFTNDRLDLGAQVGGGIELLGSVWIDIRYGVGFSRVHEEIPESEYIATPDKPLNFKNRTIQTSLKIPIKIKKPVK